MFGIFGQDDPPESGDGPGDEPLDWIERLQDWAGPWKKPAAHLSGALIKLLLQTSSESRGRWKPVGKAARRLGTVVGELFVMAMTIERPGDFEISGDAARTINERVAELIGVLPSLAATYEDIERVDAVMRDRRQVARVWEALSDFVGFLADAVEAVVARVAERALDPQAPPVELERIEKALSILEAIVREVLVEWVLPRTLGRASEDSRDE